MSTSLIEAEIAPALQYVTPEVRSHVIACVNTIHRIAARLGVDPLKLAESGAVELMCEHYGKDTVLDILHSRHRVDRALAACRQTEDAT